MRKLALAWCCRLARVPYVAQMHSGGFEPWLAGSAAEPRRRPLTVRACRGGDRPRRALGRADAGARCRAGSPSCRTRSPPPSSRSLRRDPPPAGRAASGPEPRRCCSSTGAGLAGQGRRPARGGAPRACVATTTCCASSATATGPGSSRQFARPRWHGHGRRLARRRGEARGAGRRRRPDRALAARGAADGPARGAGGGRAGDRDRCRRRRRGARRLRAGPAARRRRRRGPARGDRAVCSTASGRSRRPSAAAPLELPPALRSEHAVRELARDLRAREGGAGAAMGMFRRIVLIGGAGVLGAAALAIVQIRVGSLFGVSGELDAFFVGAALPSVLLAIGAAAISSLVVPRLPRGDPAQTADGGRADGRPRDPDRDRARPRWSPGARAPDRPPRRPRPRSGDHRAGGARPAHLLALDPGHRGGLRLRLLRLRLRTDLGLGPVDHRLRARLARAALRARLHR